MPETTAEPGERALSDEEILVPHKEVKLTNGTRVLVAPWGVTQGKLVFARLETLTPKLEGGDIRAYQLLSKAYDEIVDLVAMTVEVERSEIEKKPTEGGWTFDDLIEVTEAVLEVCILRSDGRGALPLLLSLYGTLNELAARSTGPMIARQRLRDSEKGDTSKATSGGNSGSKARRKKARSSRRSSTH